MYVKVKRMADLLKPGEICSIDQALKLGLYDIETEAYLSTSTVDLSDTRTYRTDEATDYQKKKAFCRQYKNESISYPLCPLVGGIPYTQAPGDPSRCIPAKCPPGFKQNPNDITECIKPTDYMYANRSQECGEKPYDWYSIPNYHLGNRYSKIGNACYRPCEIGTVPLVRTDPVDGTEWNIASSDSNIYGHKCTPKTNYMNAKYSNDNEFCPIAVIKRLSTLPSTLQSELQQKTNEMVANIPNRSSVRQQINSKFARDATNIATSCHLALDNVKSGSKQFQVACEKMVTSDEIVDTYSICKNLKYHPNKIIGGWRTEMGNDDEDINIKRAVMEQACHEVFCNKPENAMEAGEQPLCFKIKKVDTTAYNNKWSGSSIPSPSSTSTPSAPECEKDPSTGLCINRAVGKVTNSTVQAPGTQFATDFVNRSEKIFIISVMTLASLLLFYFLVIRKGAHVANAFLGRCSSG
jgi:hypothetical protein